MKHKKQKLLSITKKILTILSFVAFNTIDNILELYPKRVHQRVFGSNIPRKLLEKNYQEQQIKQALYKLNKQRYLEKRKVGDKILYKLTTKGLHQSLLAKIKIQTEILPNNQYCLICFDIPESARDLRRALRRILKNMHFKQLQKSVWYTNKNIFVPLTLYIKNLKADDWIKVIMASKIG